MPPKAEHESGGRPLQVTPARQPAVAHLPRLRIEGPLPVADAVHDRGLFVGQGHTFGPAQRDLLCAALSEALG